MFIPDGEVCGVNQKQGPSEEEKSRKRKRLFWLQ